MTEWRKLPVSLTELCINTTLRCGQSFRYFVLLNLLLVEDALTTAYADGGSLAMTSGLVPFMVVSCPFVRILHISTTVPSSHCLLKHPLDHRPPNRHLVSRLQWMTTIRTDWYTITSTSVQILRSYMSNGL